MANLLAPGRDPGLLRQQRQVGIDDAPRAPREHFQHRSDELAAVGAAPARVAVGKVLADVPQARGSEQGIDQRMQEHVAVGMRHDAMSVRDAHPAEQDTDRSPIEPYAWTGPLGRSGPRLDASIRPCLASQQQRAHADPAAAGRDGGRVAV